MNAKKEAKLKTNEFNKDVKIKDGTTTKTYKVKIPKERDVKFNDENDYSGTEIKTISGKAVEKIDANKEKIEKIDEQPDVNIEVILAKDTWGRKLQIKKVGDKEVDNSEKAEVSVKGNMFIWPTWTLIIGGSLVALAITVGLIWALLKKDGDEE